MSLAVGGSTVKYDKDGNATSYGSLGYGWDFLNRLTSAGDGTATSTYAYDYQGNRVLKVASSSTTVYPNDLYNVSSSTAIRNVFSNEGTLIATIQGTSTLSAAYIHPDNLGSTNVTTDSSGTLTATDDYYPYGSARINIGSDQQRQFIGEEYDGDTALSYLNARYYDGTRGQFLSQDPVFWGVKQNYQDPQSLNTYSYAENNPITQKDPTGKTIWDQINELNSQTNGTLGDEIQAELQGYGQALATIGSYLPITGNAVALGEAINGKDYTNGEPISGASRALLFASSLLNPEAGGEGEMLNKLAQNSSRFANSGELAKFIGDNAAAHSFVKHVLGFGNKMGAEYGTMVKSEAQLSEYVQGAIKNSSITKALVNGRTAFWDSRLGSVIIYNAKSPEKSTVFRPENGFDYFKNDLK